MNYNNKVLIDKVPDEYDFIIKIRSDAKLINQFPIYKVKKAIKNCVYFQFGYIANKKQVVYGTRWDTFFMGKTKSLKCMYHNFYNNCKLHIVRYLKKSIERRPEYFIGMMIKDAKLKKKAYIYTHDKDWTVTKSKDMLNYG